MKKAKWEYAGLCMCLPDLNFICPSCKREGKTEPSLSPLLTEPVEDPAPPPETIEESEVFDDLFSWPVRDNPPCPSDVGDNCPWDDADLPDRLRGYGYRLPDQDGGTGREWVTPQADFEATLIEAVRVLFEAEEIP